MCTEKCLFRQKPKGWQIANRVASTQYGGQRKVARDLGVLDRRPPVIDGHEKLLDYQQSCFFPSLCSIKIDHPFVPTCVASGGQAWPVGHRVSGASRA